MIGYNKPQSNNLMEQKPSKSRQKVTINDQKSKINISLWLDEYDNFFSDFDPRPYSQRSFSDDFLDEVKKITHEIKPGIFKMTFLIPLNKRNKPIENIIRERLRSYFRKQFTKLEKERVAFRNRGIILAFLGISLMICSIIVTESQTITHTLRFLRAFLEPSGWFCAWYGLDQIFYRSKENGIELNFNKRMSRAEFNFDSY